VGEIGKPEKVKLLCGLIFCENISFEEVRAILAAPFGQIDLETEPFPFDFTRYYCAEMGESLKRAILSFANLIDPGDLAEIKILTNRVEAQFGKVVAGQLKRRVNIDPGYLEASKLILASTKNFSHRIYLREGIFAEVTLIFRQGRFEELEWTYPDYRTKRVKDFLLKMRERYLSQLRGETPKAVDSKQ
jgi:hypothetical protein